jgi:hypothetical protein
VLEIPLNTPFSKGGFTLPSPAFRTEVVSS